MGFNKVMKFISDYLIVGAGLFGAVCARELTDKGYKCLVIDKRNTIGGNCYTDKIENITFHKYGAHIFHTSNKTVWDYVNKYVEFNNYRHHVVANYDNKLYSLPFNMFTFNTLWGIKTPDEAEKIINQQKFIGNPANLEEQAMSLVGKDVYEKFIKGYTIKQWMKHPTELPSFIIKRLPVRFTYDTNYFFDKYQGVPVNGYTELFEKLLDGIDVELNFDYFLDRENITDMAEKVIYTGEIDKFYDFKYGKLEYRSLRFEHELIQSKNYQGHSVINYTDEKIPYTRIIEHKHFNNDVSDKTIVTTEYPALHENCNEPYYPVNDERNNLLFEQYRELANNEKNVIFGGRLAEYKYFDMDKTIESALKAVNKILIPT